MEANFFREFENWLFVKPRRYRFAKDRKNKNFWSRLGVLLVGCVPFYSKLKNVAGRSDVARVTTAERSCDTESHDGGVSWHTKSVTVASPILGRSLERKPIFRWERFLRGIPKLEHRPGVMLNDRFDLRFVENALPAIGCSVAKEFLTCRNLTRLGKPGIGLGRLKDFEVGPFHGPLKSVLIKLPSKELNDLLEALDRGFSIATKNQPFSQGG